MVVVVGHGRGVPVDETTAPLDCAFAVGWETCRPKRQLNLARGLGEGVAVGCGVPGIVTVEHSDALAINIPCDGVYVPIDGIVVEVTCYILLASDILSVVICSTLVAEHGK